MPTPMKFNKSWADITEDDDDVLTTYNTHNNNTTTMSPTQVAIQSSPNYVPSPNTIKSINQSSLPNNTLSWGDLVSKVVPASKHVTTPKQVINAFELDDSNDGLPLMIKQMNKPSELEQINEETTEPSISEINDTMVSSTLPSRSASLVRTDSKLVKRKQTESTLSTVTAWCSNKTSELIKSITGSTVDTDIAERSPEKPKKQKLTESTELRRSARKSSIKSTITEDTEQENIDSNVQNNGISAAERRLQVRLNSVNKMKATPMYKNYISLVPYNQRTATMPRTPKAQSKTQNYSKRGWDGLIRVWKRQLNEFKTIEIAQASIARYQAVAAGQPIVSDNLVQQQWVPKQNSDDGDWEKIESTEIDQ